MRSNFKFPVRTAGWSSGMDGKVVKVPSLRPSVSDKSQSLLGQAERWGCHHCCENSYCLEGALSRESISPSS